MVSTASSESTTSLAGVAPPKRLSDYRPFPFAIPRIELNVVVHQPDSVLVTANLYLEPAETRATTPLILRGVDLELVSIALDGQPLASSSYHLNHEQLEIFEPPTQPFTLTTVSRLDPQANTSLEGLYESGGMLTTQCEAEGFRRITFHPDRPDVLSRYRVRIEADRTRFPVLLSNGNEISASALLADDSRHEVVWEDPFPKPSYLFALVAGDLREIRDHYVTASGRKVTLRLHVEAGDEPFTAHAMASLKRSMEWDESVYGLEYDLDEFNTVAVRHFNMGAMENKSLNIFNSKLVLADAESATDGELERIESVVGHEYFHNWSGNRITCRDWFQLSLKEGLTVFRDQCFTADLHSEPLKRIEDAAMLRNTQFREDAGPTAHPVKPDSYQAIDNFYTTTIYEKGAELIRMLRTLLGPERFMRGMSLFFKRHDGEAATTEDFVAAIVDGAGADGQPLGFDVEQFRLWYLQAGTPHVAVKSLWDGAAGRLSLTLQQSTAPTPGQEWKQALVIPVLWSVLQPNGCAGEERLLVLDQEAKTIVLEGLPPAEQPPVLSLFRRFSAPVTWDAGQAIDDLFALFAGDNDAFARWDAGQQLWKRLILPRAAGTPQSELESRMLDALRQLLADSGEQDPAVLATLLAFPGPAELESLQSEADPPALERAACELREQLGSQLAPLLRFRLDGVASSLDQVWPAGQGERQLTGLIWSWLAAAGDSMARSDAAQAVQGPSMTLARAGLRALQPIDCIERDQALQSFHDRWQERPVIFDTWFSLEASTPRADALERVAALLEHPRYDPMAPNSVRAVLGGLVGNPRVFHALDGSGYQFMAEQIIAVDQRNAITASRLAKVFSRWRTYGSERQAAVKRALSTLAKADLSTNTREVVTLMEA
ncbi:aminopeptidase N [Synechococcus sp. UW179A]|uniref:aminopeptidase N n=1 Tax=Synechococcus sp. UW179A TaxID=2575510 RepID=UPI001482ABE1|nr:aminopeptidase N [Synechococcus sp. UW179A]